MPNSTAGAVSIPAMLGGYPVTSIGVEAFYSCRDMTCVTLPDSVTKIGARAFYNCSGLTNVTISGGVTGVGDRAFYNCYSLACLRIPDSVTSLGNQVFASCSSLKTLYVPGCWKHRSILENAGVPSGCQIAYGRPEVVEGVEWIYSEHNGQATVSDVRACGTSVSVPSVLGGCPVSAIGEYAFSDASGLAGVALPDSVTDIGSRSFYNCSDPTEVTLGKCVARIGDSAFYGCIGLTDVTLPDSLANIGDSVFFRCSGLSDVRLGNGVTNIGSRAFCYCTCLTNMAIPDSVTAIGRQAFSNCFDLADVAIGNRVESIGDGAFSGCGLHVLVAPTAWKGTEQLQFAGVPSGCRVAYGQPEIVEGMEWVYAVDNGQATVTAVLADSGSVAVPSVLGGCPVTAIGESAFANASGLTGVTLPDGVRRFGDHAFAGCSGLGSLAISDLTTEIGTEAFSGCPGLTRVTILDSAATIGINAFSGSGLRVLVVPMAWKGTGKSRLPGRPRYCVNSLGAGSRNV